MPLTVIAKLVAKPGQEEALFAELQNLVAPTKAESGCMTYDLHRSDEQSGTFVFTESWADRDLWQAHMQSPHLQEFGSKQDALVQSWDLFTGEKV